MKRILATLALTLAATAAFALPRPAQIEDALAAHRYEDARTMIRDVLHERPDSARAHLLNAFVLSHVDHNSAAASAELETAKGLDKRGDIKSSPLFGRVVGELDTMTTINKPAVAKGATKQVSDHNSNALMVICVLLAVLIAAYLIFRMLRPTPASSIYLGGGGSAAPSPAMASTGPWLGSGGAAAPHPLLMPAAHQPMGAFENAASVAGGVVAGNAISDLIRSRTGSKRDDDWESRSSRSSSESTSSGTSVGYDTERSSFSSSGSGSSDWGGSSSSSSDSSSSMSSSDSGGSWD